MDARDRFVQDAAHLSQVTGHTDRLRGSGAMARALMLLRARVSVELMARHG